MNIFSILQTAAFDRNNEDEIFWYHKSFKELDELAEKSHQGYGLVDFSDPKLYDALKKSLKISVNKLLVEYLNWINKFKCYNRTWEVYTTFKTILLHDENWIFRATLMRRDERDTTDQLGRIISDEFYSRLKTTLDNLSDVITYRTKNPRSFDARLTNSIYFARDNILFENLEKNGVEIIAALKRLADQKRKSILETGVGAEKMEDLGLLTSIIDKYIEENNIDEVQLAK